MNVPVTQLIPGVAPGLPPGAQSLSRGVAPSAFLDTLTGALARFPETRSAALDRLVTQFDRETPRAELVGLAEGLVHPALPQIVASLVGAEGRAARLSEALPAPLQPAAGPPSGAPTPGSGEPARNAAPAVPVDVVRALAASNATAGAEGPPADPTAGSPAERALRLATAPPGTASGIASEASALAAAAPRAEAATVEAPREVAAETLRNLAQFARAEGSEARSVTDRVEPAAPGPAAREPGLATEARSETGPDADARARDDSGSPFREEAGSRFRDDAGSRFRHDPSAAFRDDPGARFRLEGASRVAPEGARLPDPAAPALRDALGRPVPAEIAGGVAAAPSAEAPATPGATAPGREAVPVSRATEAMAAHVERLATADGGTARIRLHPQSLGELHLQVRVRGQAVEVTVVAHEAAAKAVVEGGREQLADALSTRELRMESFEVHGGPREEAARDARSEGGRGLRDSGHEDGRSNGQDGRGDPRAPNSDGPTLPGAFSGLARVASAAAEGRGHWVT